MDKVNVFWKWLKDNKEWVFSGIGVLIFSIVISIVFLNSSEKKEIEKTINIEKTTIIGEGGKSTEVNINDGGVVNEQIVGDKNVYNTTTTNRDTKVAELLNKGLPESVFVVVNIDNDTSDQIRLFPQDEVRVFASSDNLTDVWFGKNWEPFFPNKTYVVWGMVTPSGPKSVTPKFKGTAGSYLKIKVSFTRYRDKLRDLWPQTEEKPAK